MLTLLAQASCLCANRFLAATPDSSSIFRNERSGLTSWRLGTAGAAVALRCLPPSIFQHRTASLSFTRTHFPDKLNKR